MTLVRTLGGYAPWGMPLLLVVVALAIRYDAVLNHDVAWLYIAAGRMLDGGSYAHDVFEVNMPLAILIYCPARLLADVSGLAPSRAIWSWVFLLSGQCLWLIGRIDARHLAGISRPLSTPLGMSWLIAALLYLPGYHFAQREHLVVILGLPFVWMMARPSSRPGRGLRCYVSALAAVGFCIKPHYVALPALLLIYAAIRARSFKPILSCETICLLAVGLVNLALTVLLYPDWFDCARWASDLYGAYRQATTSAVLLAPPFPVFAVAALVVSVVAGWRRDFARAVMPMLMMSGYGLVAYCLQGKGWEYQLLPASIPIFILVGQAVAYCWKLQQETPAKRVLTGGALAAALLMAATVMLSNSPDKLPSVGRLKQSEIGQALAIAPPGEPVYAFSTTMVPVLPTVLLLELEWSSRFPSLWPLAGIEWRKRHSGTGDGPPLSYYAQHLRQMVLADLRRYEPGVVLLDRRPGQFGLPPGYDILNFFLADAGFRTNWQRYRRVGQSRDYVIWVRQR